MMLRQANRILPRGVAPRRGVGARHELVAILEAALFETKSVESEAIGGERRHDRRGLGGGLPATH